MELTSSSVQDHFASNALRLARRGGRCPSGAHAVAVFASLRLRCGTRTEVASPNSLRSLRSLCSNSGDESVDEARCARRPQRCAPRRHRNRPRQAPPAAKSMVCSFPQTQDPADRQGSPGQAAARVGGAEKRRARGLARSASCQLTRRVCSSAVSEANVASYATGPRERASQGSRSAAETASVVRRGLPGRTLAASTIAAIGDRRRTTATGLDTSVAPRSFGRCGSRAALMVLERVT